MKRDFHRCCRGKGQRSRAAQHLDDLAESFVMSAFNNGTLRTMGAHYTNKDGSAHIGHMAYQAETRKFSSGVPAVISENCLRVETQERHRVKKMSTRKTAVRSSTATFGAPCCR